MNCKIARRVSEVSCANGSPPTHFVRDASSCGPLLRRGAAYYYFDSCSGINFPTHDPCGENQDNGLKNVKNPHGNSFVRGCLLLGRLKAQNLICITNSPRF